MLWSDETKIEVFGHMNLHHVWRTKRMEYKACLFIATVKYGGGSLMLCSCLAASGTRAPVKFSNTMNSIQYWNILAQNLVASVWRLKLGCGCIMAVSVPRLQLKTCGLNFRGQFTRENPRISMSWKCSAWKSAPRSLHMCSPTLLNTGESECCHSCQGRLQQKLGSRSALLWKFVLLQENLKIKIKARGF